MKVSSREPWANRETMPGKCRTSSPGTSTATAPALPSTSSEFTGLSSGARSSRLKENNSETAAEPAKRVISRSSSPASAALSRIGEFCCVYCSGMDATCRLTVIGNSGAGFFQIQEARGKVDVLFQSGNGATFGQKGLE